MAFYDYVTAAIKLKASEKFDRIYCYKRKTAQNIQKIVLALINLKGDENPRKSSRGNNLGEKIVFIWILLLWEFRISHERFLMKHKLNLRRKSLRKLEKGNLHLNV